MLSLLIRRAKVVILMQLLLLVKMTEAYNLTAMSSVNGTITVAVEMKKHSIVGISKENQFIHTNSSSRILLATPPAPTTTSVHTTTFMIGRIHVGKQPFDVMFDSGSSDLWVFGKKVNRNYFNRQKTTRFRHHFYDKKKSKTFRASKSLFGSKMLRIKYGDGSVVEGPRGFESVSLGGLEIENAPFSYIKKMGGPKDQFTQFDGIFGLGYERPKSKGRKLNAFTVLASTGKLRHNIFSIYLADNGVTGEITLGGWEPKYFDQQSVHFFPVLKSSWGGHWVIGVKDIKLGTTKQLPSRKGKLTALIDSGCSHVLVPKGVLSNTKSQVIQRALKNRNKNFVGRVPCSDRDTLPLFELAFGSTEFTLTLTGNEYTTSRPSYIDPKTKVPWCSLLVREKDIVTDEGFLRVTVGEPFMRKYYTIFAFESALVGVGDDAQIGFATAVHPLRSR